MSGKEGHAGIRETGHNNGKEPEDHVRLRRMDRRSGAAAAGRASLMMQADRRFHLAITLASVPPLRHFNFPNRTMAVFAHGFESTPVPLAA